MTQAAKFVFETAFDLAAARRWRVGAAITAKTAFNQTRPHRHGKQF
ncbi:MAG: hypothetical protein ACFUZC_15635 [Chthoniobacteraceae bacterium]